VEGEGDGGSEMQREKECCETAGRKIRPSPIRPCPVRPVIEASPAGMLTGLRRNPARPGPAHSL
jgi:hypothetical protein